MDLGQISTIRFKRNLKAKAKAKPNFQVKFRLTRYNAAPMAHISSLVLYHHYLLLAERIDEELME